MTPIIEKVSANTSVTFYYVEMAQEWRWSWRNINHVSAREGWLSSSTGGFDTLERAKEDFYMNHNPQQAPWPMIIGIVLAIAAMLAAIALTNLKAHAHDIYSTWTYNGQDCCKEQDCFQSRVWKEEYGWFALDREGNKVPVPEDKIDPDFPNHGVSHVCIYNGRVLCAAVGTGG